MQLGCLESTLFDMRGDDIFFLALRGSHFYNESLGLFPQNISPFFISRLLFFSPSQIVFAPLHRCCGRRVRLVPSVGHRHRHRISCTKSSSSVDLHNHKGFLAPFKGCRYHQEQFRVTGRARNANEVFNTVHSSLRSAIERTFGVWKARWGFLHNMPWYDFGKVQVPLVANAEHFIFSDMPNIAGVGDDDELDPVGDDDIEMNKFRKSIRNVLVQNRRELRLKIRQGADKEVATLDRPIKHPKQWMKPNTFTKADCTGICYLHNDPLVIFALLSNYKVRRVPNSQLISDSVHRQRSWTSLLERSVKMQKVLDLITKYNCTFFSFFLFFITPRRFLLPLKPQNGLETDEEQEEKGKK
ncbi:hypothetical protein LOK49_Contig93G00009, partial [Camellia lanceoleosa]